MFESHVRKQVVEEKAARTPGKKSLAIEAYARALRAIPGTICDNAGEPSSAVLCFPKEQPASGQTCLASGHLSSCLVSTLSEFLKAVHAGSVCRLSRVSHHMVLLAAGLDSAELISQLRAAHAEDNTRMGVDVVLGKAGDMADLGIYECYRVSTANAPCCFTCTAVICKACILDISFDSLNFKLWFSFCRSRNRSFCQRRKLLK